MIMVCKQCGNEIADNITFCSHCGANLQSGAPSTFSQNQTTYQDYNGTERKDWLTTLLLCLFVGSLGIHRFYTKHTGIGIAQLLTLGGCGIWALVDLIMIITGAYKDADGLPLVRKN